MTWPLWSILVAGLLPYAGTAIAKWGFIRFDNHHPREWLAQQSGFRARGNAAQANSFESFPFYAAAVLVATVQQAPLAIVSLCCTVYILARMSYIICYAANWAGARSLSWLVGIMSIVGLFIAASR